MKRLSTQLDGPVVVAPDMHADDRGFFLETFRAEDWARHGVDETWVQDNHSRSRQGTLRGMHFQPGQAKLVRCARGAVFDAVVDIRPDSETYGRWESWVLDDRDMLALYVPDGFAHGFCVLTDEADVVYKCSTYYDPHTEAGFAYDDPAVGIEWPHDLEPLVSGRDRAAPPLEALIAAR